MYKEALYICLVRAAVIFLEITYFSVGTASPTNRKVLLPRRVLDRCRNKMNRFSNPGGFGAATRSAAITKGKLLVNVPVIDFGNLVESAL